MMLAPSPNDAKAHILLAKHHGRSLAHFLGSITHQDPSLLPYTTPIVLPCLNRQLLEKVLDAQSGVKHFPPGTAYRLHKDLSDNLRPWLALLVADLEFYTATRKTVIRFIEDHFFMPAERPLEPLSIGIRGIAALILAYNMAWYQRLLDRWWGLWPGRNPSPRAVIEQWTALTRLLD